MIYLLRELFTYTMIILIGAGGSLMTVLNLEAGNYFFMLLPLFVIFPISAYLLSKVIED